MEIWENLSLENIWYTHPETGMLTEEEWRPIKNHEEIYEISILGRVKMLKRYRKHSSNHLLLNPLYEKIKKQHLNKLLGYLYISLTNKEGSMTTQRVHTLVAKEFIPNPENKKEVNHKKGEKIDNRAWTLEWNTALENTHNAFKNGHPSKRIKIKPEDIPIIKQLYLEGKTNGEIAKLYNVKRKSIWRITTNRNWQFLN